MFRWIRSFAVMMLLLVPLTAHAANAQGGSEKKVFFALLLVGTVAFAALLLIASTELIGCGLLSGVIAFFTSGYALYWCFHALVTGDFSSGAYICTGCLGVSFVTVIFGNSL